MRKNKKIKKKVQQNRFEKILEIPKEISSAMPKITIMGFEEILIENYVSILEYQDFYVRLNTKIGIININGFSLSLKEMTGDDIKVIGKIDSIDFEETIG